MPRRLLLFSLVCLIAVMASTTGRPARADRIQSLQAKIAEAQVQESRLQSDIGSIEGRIRTLENQVGGVSTKLDALEHDLELQQIRLNRIRRLYQFQTQQLDFFSHEYNVSVERLNARLIEIYETQQEPSTLDVLMSAHSLERLPRPGRLRPQHRLTGCRHHDVRARRQGPVALGARQDRRSRRRRSRP